MTHEEFEVLKRGDRIRCVEPGTLPLTFGEWYMVLGVFSGTRYSFILMDNDEGVCFSYLSTRFEVGTDTRVEVASVKEERACDCGARVCNTTHAFWCSIRND